MLKKFLGDNKKGRGIPLPKVSYESKSHNNSLRFTSKRLISFGRFNFWSDSKIFYR